MYVLAVLPRFELRIPAQLLKLESPFNRPFIVFAIKRILRNPSVLQAMTTTAPNGS